MTEPNKWQAPPAEVTPPSQPPSPSRSRSSSPSTDDRAGRRALVREPSATSSRLGSLSASSASVAAAAFWGERAYPPPGHGRPPVDEVEEMQGSDDEARPSLKATLAGSPKMSSSIDSSPATTKGLDLAPVKDDIDSSRSDEGVDVNWNYRAVDFIALLPPELSIYIMQCLPSHEDVLRCTLVNRLWRSRAMDQSVWRHLFERQAERGWALRDDAELLWARLRGLYKFEARMQRLFKARRRRAMIAAAASAFGEDARDAMDLSSDVDGLSLAEGAQGTESGGSSSRRGSATPSDGSHASSSGTSSSSSAARQRAPPFDPENTFDVSYEDPAPSHADDGEGDIDFDDSRVSDMVPQAAPRSSLPGWPALYAARFALGRRWNLETARPVSRQPSILATLGRMPSNGFFPHPSAGLSSVAASAGSPPPTPLDMPGYLSPPLVASMASGSGNIPVLVSSPTQTVPSPRPRRRFNPTLRQLTGHGDSVYCVRFDAARWAPPLVGLPNLEAVDLAWRIEKEHGDYVGWVEDKGSSSGGESSATSSSSSGGHSGRTTPEERKARRDRQALVEEAWQKVKDGLGTRGRIVSGSRDRAIKVWDAQTGSCVYTLQGHKGSVLCLEYDDTLMVSGSSDKSILVWDFRLGRHQRPASAASGDETMDGAQRSDEAEADRSQSLGAGVFPDVEESMAPTSTSSAASHPIYEGAPRAIARLRGHVAGVLDVSLSREWILSCGKDSTVRVWSRKDLSCHRVYRGHLGPVNAGRLSEPFARGESAKAVSACGHGGIQLWDVTTGETLRSFVGHERGLACIAFKRGVIVSGSNDQTVRVWDEATGRCLAICVGHTSLVRAVSLDARRNLVVSAGYDRQVMLWDISHVVAAARRGVPVTVQPEAAVQAQADEASPNPADKPVRLRPVLELAGHTARVFDVQLDSTRIMSSSEDLRVAVRDFATERPVMRLFA